MARFARDVAVDGKARLSFAEGRSFLRARVTVDGPSGADGFLRLRGHWFDAEARRIRISGWFAGRRVAASVPAG